MPNYTPEQKENARKLYLKLHAQGENPTAKRIADEMGMPLRYIQNLMSPSEGGWVAQAKAQEAGLLDETLSKLSQVMRVKKISMQLAEVLLVGALRDAKAKKLKLKDPAEVTKFMRSVTEFIAKTAEAKPPESKGQTQIGTLNVLNVGKLDDKARAGLNALLDAAHGQVAMPAEVVEEGEACAS